MEAVLDDFLPHLVPLSVVGSWISADLQNVMVKCDFFLAKYRSILIARHLLAVNLVIIHVFSEDLIVYEIF